MAATLGATTPALSRSLVLEELPGPVSVARADEARNVLSGATDGRTDRGAAIRRTRHEQPRWHDKDCQHAVNDLGELSRP